MERRNLQDCINVHMRVIDGPNAVPNRWLPLFFRLVARMGKHYPDSRFRRMVTTSGPAGEEIIKAMGWTQRDSLQKGLRELCKCGAIRRVNQSVYEVNPSYVEVTNFDQRQ